MPSDRRALEDPGFRKAMFEDYGEFLTSLNGSYVCAEDVGLNVEVCREWIVRDGAGIA